MSQFIHDPGDISAIQSSFASGTSDPVSFLEAILQRAQAVESHIHAWLSLDDDSARNQARRYRDEMQKGRIRGPLHGIPYAVKDIFDVGGVPTTAGSVTLGENVPAQDCTVTRKLREAGMIVLGKTITVEFAKGIAGINHIQGTPHNPWHATPHIPGGSSAGSAVAVASGMAPMALGSDTGGSVRAPAALGGTVGLKTTVGRVSRHGVFPLSWSLDSVGPLTRSVEDAALVYQAMLGEDLKDDSTIGIPTHDVMPGLKTGVKGLRIGMPRDIFFDDLDPEVAAAMADCAQVFRDLGAHVENIAYPEAREAPARYRHGCAAVGARLFVFGGRLSRRAWVDHHASPSHSSLTNNQGV